MMTTIISDNFHKNTWQHRQIYALSERHSHFPARRCSVFHMHVLKLLTSTRSDRLGLEFLSTTVENRMKSGFLFKTVLLNLPTMPKQNFVNMPTNSTKKQIQTQIAILINIDVRYSPRACPNLSANLITLSGGFLSKVCHFSK